MQQLQILNSPPQVVQERPSLGQYSSKRTQLPVIERELRFDLEDEHLDTKADQRRDECANDRKIYQDNSGGVQVRIYEGRRPPTTAN